MLKLAEVVKKDQNQFTQAEWSALGKHHAQALFARCWEGTHYRLPNGSNILYLECVQAAARYELDQAEGFEKDYWRTYIITLNLSVLAYERRWGLFLIAHNGRKLANVKTGSLIA